MDYYFIKSNVKESLSDEEYKEFDEHFNRVRKNLVTLVEKEKEFDQELAVKSASLGKSLIVHKTFHFKLIDDKNVIITAYSYD